MSDHHSNQKASKNSRERRRELNTYGIWAEDYESEKNNKYQSKRNLHKTHKYDDLESIQSDNSQIGKWEEHTKGIGMKLLQKMGYKSGEGLGTHGQGIKKPVEMKKSTEGRGKGIIIGELHDNHNNEKKYEDVIRQYAKKRPVKTINELIEQNKDFQIMKKTKINLDPLSSTKIIDKTGKNDHVYESYKELSTFKNDIELFSEDLQPLMKNLDKIIAQIEVEILDSYFSEQEHSKSVDKLTKEYAYHENIINQKSMDIDKIKSLVQMVEMLESMAINTEMSPESKIDNALEIYSGISNSGLDEFLSIDINQTILSAFESTIIDLFKSWNPIENPFFGYEQMLKIVKLIEGSPKFSNTMNYFLRIMKKSWLPQLNFSLNSMISFKTHSSFLSNLIIQWSKIIDTKFIQIFFINPHIIPMIIQEIRMMNPNLDFQKAFLWIIPWKNLVGTSINIIYNELLKAFGFALQMMTLADPRTILVSLKPLKHHIPPETLTNFSTMFILPLVSNLISRIEFDISCPDHSCDILCKILELRDLIPDNQMSHVFNKFFFPKWISYVSRCFDDKDNLENLVNFYQTFKERLTAIFPESDAVTNGFNETIIIMNRFLSGDHNDPRNTNETSIDNNTNILSNFALSNKESTIKDALQRRCIENDINFIPMPSRSVAGTMLYKIGHLTIAINQDMILLVPPEGIEYGKPISIDSLFEKI